MPGGNKKVTHLKNKSVCRPQSLNKNKHVGKNEQGKGK